MAQQCFRSLGTRLPLSPFSQALGGAGMILKPPSSPDSTFKPGSRPFESHIPVLNSSRRSSLPQNALMALPAHGAKPLDSSLIIFPRQIDLAGHYYQLLREERENVLLSSKVVSTGSVSGDKSPSGSDPGSEKPNQDQLQRVHDILTDSISKLFLQPMNYRIYSQNIVFINNIRNKTTQYVQQVAYVRIVGHVKFAYVDFKILNTNISTEDSRITVRWRIRGISGLRVMLTFWKYRLWELKEMMNTKEDWFDGISYFDVGSDGLIFRHIADRVMEDKGPQVVEVNQTKAALAAKLGLLASLFPQPTSIALSKKADDSLQHKEMYSGGLQAMRI